MEGGPARGALGDRFREDFELPLTALAYVIFRVVSELRPMRELPGVIEAASEGSPDEELRRACDDRIPSRRGVVATN